ncbi:bifunctional DNA-formamidopyrimidine glycosylase/DNA-(apurinic or apyrimidinic site) lyase [Thalassotalea sp. LPB0316]|uniref:bifunctional DNA-formamidopyrimidine glycosylase/DNA-(apurinic or apyrimidinic site) lyase n=1 Tax=Thalassotalea sp. LPB0316 TaxID=2769490 RepID=UPI0018665BEE|nr:bifunctional DNA-formamidopyrimidine glycosylase/DNA-(apurinic or apyrimidinic site) lyase [Thalassotalea sp. LPB0316]QOL26467.1 bifunctional DNA-formamidopyrimidine glycosylase/DNA-(apurinic or apyrimidinic site) lyase [Thalassotalea sp. LPB0316]
MPELPEVEVCKLGISPHIIGQKVDEVVVRYWQLRWPIPEAVLTVKNQILRDVQRRSKYLMLVFDHGTLLIHLGMSGTIRVVNKDIEVVKHDHFDLAFVNGNILRLNDPRRFGAVLWLPDHQDIDGVLAKLGPEPLTDAFNADYLFACAKGRKTNIKNFLMSNPVVVGVGNIYANEALFLAGILPTALAGNISKRRIAILVDTIKAVLESAISQGGTTLKDFTQADGKPGYFAQSLNVYGRGGQPCLVCETELSEIRQSNRATVYCKKCQKK